MSDVYETDDKIPITLEIAGLDLKTIEISLYEDALVVEGQRYLKLESSQRLYHMAFHIC